MRHLAFRLAALLLTFVIGITVAASWRALTCPGLNPSSKVEIHPPPIPTTQRSYEFGPSIACGFSEGHRTSFSMISSSDGMRFSTTIVYNSPKGAAKEFQTRLKQPGVKVFSRKTRLDDKGQQIGEEAVIVFLPHVGLSDSTHAELLWRNAGNFGLVESSSLGNILEYQKDHLH